MFNKKLLLLMALLCAQSSFVWGMGELNLRGLSERCGQNHSDNVLISRLSHAAMCDHEYCIRRFVLEGDDINERDNQGETVLFAACRRTVSSHEPVRAKALQTIELLKSLGAREDIRNKNGLTVDGAKCRDNWYGNPF